MTGRVFGVGLGPGDPELITLKAARLIANAQVIVYPALAGEESFARSIAANLIPPAAHEIVLNIPMSVARAPAQAAYDRGAHEISGYLQRGADVICLCEGDPFFYGSFMYLFARLVDRFDVTVVPGVTSMTACAATARRPLVARNETMSVLPGPLPDAELRRRLRDADTIAIMKVGRHLPRIRAILIAEQLEQAAVYVEHATLESERRCALSDAPDAAPYFSMILITKGADPWM